MAWLSPKQVEDLCLESVGSNVLLSDRASFYGCQRIRIGNNVRIDDFSVISAGAGGIEIGNHVHVAVFCSLIGAGRIHLSDFSGLSARVSIYSSNDDYSGASLTNPTVPDRLRDVRSADVILGRHVIIGAGSVVLPGVTLGEGAAVGSLSLVIRDCEEFGVYFGSPAKKISQRKRELLELEKRLLANPS